MRVMRPAVSAATCTWLTASSSPEAKFCRASCTCSAVARATLVAGHADAAGGAEPLPTNA
ncbi:hypothetical protein D3C81_1222340 [compost metagenome]